MLDRDNPSDAEFRASLPEELQALDRELSAIRIEERPSFGPELEGELLRAWEARPRAGLRRPAPWGRMLLAACFGGLMVAGVAVPSARAAVIRLVRTVLEEAVPSLFAPVPEPEVPQIRFEEPTPVVSEMTTPSPAIPVPAEPLPSENPGEFTPIHHYTFPEILYPEEAKAIITSYYPLGLQKAGIGGSVRIWLWVRPDGVPESIQMREGSGYRSLNLAAMMAMRELRFRPATRGDTPVGTWVEFTVHFVPSDTGGVLELEPVGSEGIGGR